jgi:hypothetical protein
VPLQLFFLGGVAIFACHVNVNVHDPINLGWRDGAG